MDRLAATTETTDDPEWSAAVAQASAWIAILSGPQRTPAAERSLQTWLKEDPLHWYAFELANATRDEFRELIRRSKVRTSVKERLMASILAVIWVLIVWALYACVSTPET